jgi:putative ABC transport system substrate-binding protein
MDRRKALATFLIFGAVASGRRSGAQSRPPFRIGWLFGSDATAIRPFEQAFLAGLKQRGYVPGRNLELHIRYAEGDTTRVPVLVDELIALAPDVLISTEPIALVIARKTKTIPIVLPSSTDPVAAGLVRSLARPGTNVTGITDLWDQLLAKHIELLVELVPRMSRLAILNDASSPLRDRFEQYAKKVAAAKRLTSFMQAVQSGKEVRLAFSAFEKDRAQAVVVASTPRIFILHRDIIGAATRLRLPAVSGVALWVDNGGLLSYGANVLDSYRHAADFVDRILKGANPAEVPVEQTSRYDLSINTRTAAEIGIDIPKSILTRADRLIN